MSSVLGIEMAVSRLGRYLFTEGTGFSVDSGSIPFNTRLSMMCMTSKVTALPDILLVVLSLLARGKVALLSHPGMACPHSQRSERPKMLPHCLIFYYWAS